MLREADSGAGRQCSLKDGGQEDGDRGSLGLREIARVSKLAVQVPEQEVMSQSGKKACEGLMTLRFMRILTNPRTESL
jgi:hypothetical protein